MTYLQNKKILVTGACGTVGKELVQQLLATHIPHEVVGIDKNESALFFLDQLHIKDDRARFFLCDILNDTALAELCRGVDVIFHCAAFKHVIMCERSPVEAVQTNIVGVQNLVRAALSAGVGKVIFTSTDKAVNPTNVMGTSKLMGERLITAANSGQRERKTIFASTRFGNVLGSSGSVVPVFKKQIELGGPVTLTDPRMTRFIMSIQQAVNLVIESAELACGGEVFVTKMPVVKIRDLAKVMIDTLATDYGHRPENIEISEIGIKPGEKLYEELMSDEETRRTIELRKYFAVLPAFRSIYHNIGYRYPNFVNRSVSSSYTSAVQPAMEQGELLSFLQANRLLDNAKSSAGTQRYWPGDKEEAV